MHKAIGQKSVIKGWGEQFNEIFWSLKKLTMIIHDGGCGGSVVRYDNSYLFCYISKSV